MKSEKTCMAIPSTFEFSLLKDIFDTKGSRKARSVYRNFFKTKEKEVDSL